MPHLPESNRDYIGSQDWNLSLSDLLSAVLLPDDLVQCWITKVCQFELSFLIDEQVLGFEVSVQDFSSVAVRQTPQQLEQEYLLSREQEVLLIFLYICMRWVTFRQPVVYIYIRDSNLNVNFLKGS